MKNVCMMFCDMKKSSGVSNVAIEIANFLVSTGKYNVTLVPIYEWGGSVREKILPAVKVRSIFRFYFRGFSKIVNILPDRLLHDLFVGKEKFDIEIGFQYGKATRIMASGQSANHLTMGWMHCYDEGLVLKKCYEKFDKMICVSKCNADRLKNEMKSNLPIDYCYNPIDDKKIIEMSLEQVDIVKNRNLQLVSVARHSPEKGYSMLLKVIRKLKDDGFNFNIWLIGDGPIHDDLINESHTLGIDDYVTFLGNQKNPHKYTSKADLYVCSSFIEGYSTACTEALLLGIPVLTTNCAGGEEIIEESEVGKLVGMNEQDLYLGLKEVLHNPSTILDWKNKLKETKHRFTQASRFQRLIDILDNTKKR